MVKKFFNIDGSYSFELGDWCALTMIVNVALVIIFGLSASWFGLVIAGINLAMDMRNKHRHVNDVLIHLATIVLNSYFLYLLYAV